MKFVYTEAEKKAVQMTQMAGELEALKLVAKVLDIMLALEHLTTDLRVSEGMPDGEKYMESLNKDTVVLKEIFARYDAHTDKLFEIVGGAMSGNDPLTALAQVGLVASLVKRAKSHVDDDSDTDNKNVLAFPSQV